MLAHRGLASGRHQTHWHRLRVNFYALRARAIFLLFSFSWPTRVDVFHSCNWVWPWLFLFCVVFGFFNRGFAVEAKEGQRTRKAALTSQASGFVQTAFHAGHGFTHFAHAHKRRTVLSACVTQSASADLVLSILGRHVFP